MEDTFILSVLGACIFAAVVAVCATYGVERMGGLLGGIFETTPTTIIPAAIGIARSVSDTKELSKAMSSVPVGLLVTSTFLMVWKYLPPRLDERISSNKGLAITISASLITWLIFALFSVFSLQDVSQDRMLVVGYCSVAALLLIGFSATFYTFERNHALPNPKTDMPEEKTPVKTLIVRGCFAGVATAVTVLLSKVNEVAAGVFSTFPSIFLTTMVSLWLSKGAKLGMSAVGPMTLGCVSVCVFALTFGYFVDSLGLNVWMAALASYVAGLLYSTLLASVMWASKKHLSHADSDELLLNEDMEVEVLN